MSADKHRPKKLLRASRACDFCHKRSIRCRPSTTGFQSCQNCYDFDVACTYNRPLRRGRAAGDLHSSEPGSSLAVDIEPRDQQQHQDQNHDEPQQLSLALPRPVVQPAGAATIAGASRSNEIASSRKTNSGFTTFRGQNMVVRGEDLSEEWPETAWRAFAAASAGTIEYLVDVYFRVVYPIFPLFHQPTLLKKVRDQDYLKNHGFFTSLMAVCALASARGRDGALFESDKNASYMETVSSETFFKAVKDHLPKDLTAARELDYMRACALLSITGIQYGDIEAMQLYLGHYFTLVGIHKFHDEAYWPKNITNIEVEERRRLYWSTYTLDVFISIVWNGSVHAYGANARVHYPTEVEDELITPLATLPSPKPTISWLRGWNFTTDLYLTLEHAYSQLRKPAALIDNRIDVATIFKLPTLLSSHSSTAVLASITERYHDLPSNFKIFAPPTGNRLRDIFGFQAANIQATLLLLRMLFLSIDDDRRQPPDVQLKCNVAAELLAVFQTIPTAYLRGISTPLIYHLAGIGTILGSVMEAPLSEAAYHRVRSMLLSIADLLESLESGLSRATDISKGLRAQVERIDEYMRAQCWPVGRSYMPLQSNHSSSVDPLVQQQQPALDRSAGIDTGRAGSHEGGAQSTEVESGGRVAEGEFLHGSMGEFQLPSELLEDWPFNLQPESWSFLGLE